MLMLSSNIQTSKITFLYTQCVTMAPMPPACLCFLIEMMMTLYDIIHTIQCKMLCLFFLVFLIIFSHFRTVSITKYDHIIPDYAFS